MKVNMGGSIVDNLHGWITWTMSTGGSRVENFHGWATCGQLVTGGAHVDGRDFP